MWAFFWFVILLMWFPWPELYAVRIVPFNCNNSLIAWDPFIKLPSPQWGIPNSLNADTALALIISKPPPPFYLFLTPHRNPKNCLSIVASVVPWNLLPFALGRTSRNSMKSQFSSGPSVPSHNTSWIDMKQRIFWALALDINQALSLTREWRRKNLSLEKRLGYKSLFYFMLHTSTE